MSVTIKRIMPGMEIPAKEKIKFEPVEIKPEPVKKTRTKKGAKKNV